MKNLSEEIHQSPHMPKTGWELCGQSRSETRDVCVSLTGGTAKNIFHVKHEKFPGVVLSVSEETATALTSNEKIQKQEQKPKASFRERLADFFRSDKWKAVTPTGSSEGVFEGTELVLVRKPDGKYFHRINGRPSKGLNSANFDVARDRLVSDLEKYLGEVNER